MFLTMYIQNKLEGHLEGAGLDPKLDALSCNVNESEK